MSRFVNIGCGFSTGDSWENYDSSLTLRFERIPGVGRLYTKNDARFPANARYGDITRGPIGAADSADAVFCSHMLEHLPLESMRRALTNIHAMMKPGGVLRLIVPDLEWRARKYVEQLPDPGAAHEFMQTSGLGLRSGGRDGFASRLRFALGNSKHVWMYDEATLKEELAAAGFVEIRRCGLGDSEIPAFQEVEDPRRFQNGEHPELAVECRKPVAS